MYSTILKHTKTHELIIFMINWQYRRKFRLSVILAQSLNSSITYLKLIKILKKIHFYLYNNMYTRNNNMYTTRIEV